MVEPKTTTRLAGPAKVEPVAARPSSTGQIVRMALGRTERTLPGMREAPGLFAETAEITWDGRPTLPGLWVAHFGIERTQRARIRNPHTGAVVDVALLPNRSASRSRAPVASAEAADALDLVPHVPTQLDLVALVHANDPALHAMGQTSEVDQDILSETETPAISAPDPASPAADETQVALKKAQSQTSPSGDAPIVDGHPYILAGAFVDPSHAADLMRTLYDQGIRARNSQATIDGITVRRVLAGPFDSVAAREQALRRLRAIGVADARTIAG